MKKLFTMLFVALAAIISSCNGDEIDDLQSQIDDLNDKVSDLEQTQKDALLDAIAQLQSSIAALETSTSSELDALLESLDLIQQEVETNASSVYYGDLLVQAEYDAFAAQGATIVTGKVVALKADHLAVLADVKMIGGNLTIMTDADVTFAGLQNVGGDLMLSGSTGAVTFEKLTSVGGDVEVMSNEGLTSLVADELVLVDGILHIENNTLLNTMSFAKLDWVQELYINEYWADDPQYLGFGPLSSLDLSGVDVDGDVYITYISEGDLVIGNVGGDFTCTYTKLGSIALEGTMIGGDFTVTDNPITALTVDNLESIGGNIEISRNYNGYDWSAPEVIGLATMPEFASLETIGGDLTISGNNALKTMDSFNSVTSFKGIDVKIESNGTAMEYIRVFDALAAAGPSTYTHSNVRVYQQVNWFDGFNALQKAGVVNITIQKPTESGGGIGVRTNNAIDTETAKLEGFDALTNVQSLNIYASQVTELTAFGAVTTLGHWSQSIYLKVTLSADADGTFCSLQSLLQMAVDGSWAGNTSFQQVITHVESWGNWEEFADIDAQGAYDLAASSCGV